MSRQSPRVETSDVQDAVALAGLSADERRAALAARSEIVVETVVVPGRRTSEDGADS